MPSNYSSDITLSNGNQLKYFEDSGLPAQGIANPVSEFVNHAMVYYNGKFYDPSYGIGPFSSEQSYETAAIYGRAVYVLADIPINTPMGPMTEPIYVLYHLDHEQSNVIDLIFNLIP